MYDRVSRPIKMEEATCKLYFYQMLLAVKVHNHEFYHEKYGYAYECQSDEFFCHLSLLKPVQAISTALLTSWFNKILYLSAAKEHSNALTY